MAERWKDFGARNGWVRAVVIVVLMLGLTSLIVSALVSSHRSTPPQQTSDSPISPQSQTAQTGVSDVITPAAGISLNEVGLRSGSVQSSSTATHDPVSATKSRLSSHSKNKSQTVKARAKSTKKTVQSKVKAHTTSKKQVKSSSKNSAPSDELFPELRKH
jgi:cytoskeletal protein RodZ